MTDFKPHGDGLVSFALIRELVVRGHEIHLAGTHLELTNPLPPGLTFYAISANRAETFKDRLTYAIAARRLFNKLNRQHRFDVVLQLNPVIAGLSLGFLVLSPPLVLGAYIENWRRERPESLRGFIQNTTSKLVRDLFSSLQQIAAARIIITTRSAANRVPLATFLRRKLVIIPHGVEINSFVPVDYSKPTTPTILFMSSLTEHKGVMTLLAAFEIVCKSMPSVRLLLGGTGNAEHHVKQFIQQSRYGSQVELLGPVARMDISRTMAKATVYCLPSHGEPFGMTALEAMACGMPLVTTEESGLGEIIPINAGKKVRMRDPQALATALSSLLCLSPAERAKIGAANRAYVEQSFALAHVVDHLETVLNSLISDHNPSASALN